MCCYRQTERPKKYASNRRQRSRTRSNSMNLSMMNGDVTIRWLPDTSSTSQPTRELRTRCVSVEWDACKLLWLRNPSLWLGSCNNCIIYIYHKYRCERICFIKFWQPHCHIIFIVFCRINKTHLKRAYFNSDLNNKTLLKRIYFKSVLLIEQHFFVHQKNNLIWSSLTIWGAQTPTSGRIRCPNVCSGRSCASPKATRGRPNWPTRARCGSSTNSATIGNASIWSCDGPTCATRTREAKC